MLDLRIEKLVYGGDGLARLEGRTVLLPLVLPGELVSAEPVKEEPRLIHARLVEVREASASRVAPGCPYFARCGGCHYQHAGYDDQLRYKAAILKETLARIGKLDAPEPELIASPPWNYRNRAQFKTRKRHGRFELGFFEWGSHRLLPVEQCPISSPRVNQVIPLLNEIGKRPDFPDGEGEIEVFAGEGRADADAATVPDEPRVLLTVTADQPWPETLVSALRERMADLASLAVLDRAGATGRVFGRGNLLYRAGGFTYRVSHRSFFQTNRFLAETMAAGVTAGLKGKVALDLFCGVGYFAVPLARAFERVIAVESNPAAVRDLESNRQRARAENIEPVEQAAEQFLASWQAERRPAPGLVLLDPPRSGLGHGAAEKLAAIGAPQILYVSCDPSTLARDLVPLLAAGYRFERLTLVDLFPQTYHIESIAALLAPHRPRDSGGGSFFSAP
jgi:23S rRNA (uracil1939-C5)-methyltransferase